MKNWLLSLLAVPVALYVGALAYLYVYQRDIQYHVGEEYRSPLETGALTVSELKLQTPDGETLNAWYKKAPAGRPTVLFFHGNAGNISTRPVKISRYAIDNGMLAVSYRGFGGSSGSPSEAGFMIDAQAAYDWLIASGVKPDEIMLLGESLGTGVAIQLAAKNPVRAVGLEAPYASLFAIGQKQYWYFPVQQLMTDQFLSIDFIGRVKAPLYVIHGEADTVVPYADGQELFAKANEPKTFVSVPNAGHEIIADEKTWGEVHAFFEKVWRE